MEIDVKFTDKEITPWSGFAFLRNMTEKMGVREFFSGLDFLPKPGSNRGYSPVDIMEGFIVSVWCGANRFLHTEITRHDKALVKLFGWKQAPGNDTYKRFFRKFNHSTSQELSRSLFGWIFKNIKFDRYTLDCDSSVNTRYGSQEGAKKGYNAPKPGRASHHPLIAFVNDLKLVANFWLRSGDAHSANNFEAFLEETLSILSSSGKSIGLIRLDSGFYSHQVLSYLESKSIDYITAVKFYVPIQQMISLEQNGLPVDEGIEICDTFYQSPQWKHPRRIVVVRQKKELREKAVGKTLRLFEDMYPYYQYRYTAYVTNMNLSAVEVWRLYRQRADSENRIKEIKEDFGFDSFNLNKFWGTEAALTVALFAYNLMAIFRMFVLRSEVQHKLSTLRYRIFAIGAYFQKIKGKYVLRVSLAKQRRKWFLGLWYQSNNIVIPFSKSNA